MSKGLSPPPPPTRNPRPASFANYFRRRRRRGYLVSSRGPTREGKAERERERERGSSNLSLSLSLSSFPPPSFLLSSSSFEILRNRLWKGHVLLHVHFWISSWGGSSSSSSPRDEKKRPSENSTRLEAHFRRQCKERLGFFSPSE